MTILDQGARELMARDKQGMIAVVDRVGNVLAVWATNDGPLNILISSQRPGAVQVPQTSLQNGFENTLLPGELGAISKAITGSFLSSQGNAFSTRTANFIVNANFPPNNNLEASGPLFGVQFSQLPCGDWVRRDDDPMNTADNFLDGRAGPKRAPLGFSADPGGFPLYINGVIVGGVGVVAAEDNILDDSGLPMPVSIYGVDGSPEDSGPNVEEEVAMAAMRGFEPSDNRLSSTIAVMGRLLRYSNSDRGGNARTAPSRGLITQLPSFGTLRPVPGFYDASRVFAGVRVGTPESGIVLADGSVANGLVFGKDRSGRQINAQILVNPDGTPFLGRNSGVVTNPRDSISPVGENEIGLTKEEVQMLLDRTLAVAQESRAQIRQPDGSFVQVNVHVCDRDGNQLGYARTPDAPLFGSDVALQKCRAAAIFSRGASTAPPGQESSPSAADLFLAEDRFFDQQGKSKVGMALGITNGVRNTTMARFLERVRKFIPDDNAFADGIAYSNRSIGNLARPCFPDGVNCVPDGRGGVMASTAGPLSVDGDVRRFSPLSDGFQLEYVKDYVLDGVLGRAVGVPEPTRCGTLSANGFQIFAGGEPIFKREVDATGALTGRVYQVGAIGISGDGIDQDDAMGFLGIDRAGGLPNSRIVNAPISKRSNTIRPRLSGDTSLRYINCPPSLFNPPFEDEQNVCEGK